MKIKKGDTIKVISGDDKGKTGVVQKAFPKINKVLIDGINTYQKHQKKSMKNQEGGIVTLSRPLDASKVALVKSEKLAKPAKKTK